MKRPVPLRATHVVLTWHEEGSRMVDSDPYKIKVRTPYSLTIHDEDGRPITFTARKSGAYIRKHQVDAWSSMRVDRFLNTKGEVVLP